MVSEQSFARELVGFARRSRGSSPDGPLDGAFVVSCNGGRVLAGASQVYRGQCLVTGAELVGMLGCGMVVARPSGGGVSVFLAPEARQGRVLLLKPEPMRHEG